MASEWNLTTTEGVPDDQEEMSLTDRILLLSDHQTELANRVQRPLQYILSGVFIPLAICNVIVFAQKGMRSAAGIYVIGLNCGQIFFLLVRNMDDIWEASVENRFFNYPWCVFTFYVSLYGGVLVAKRASYAILCMASTERLYAVLRPLHIKDFLLYKRPVQCVLTVYVLSAVWHAYYFLKSRLQPGTLPNGQTYCQFTLTGLYTKYGHINEAFALAARIVLGYMSLIIQLVLNGLTVWALRRHNMATRHVTSAANEAAKRQQERQLTVCLLGASASFTLLSLPTVFFNVFAIAFPEFNPGQKYGNLYQVILQLVFNLTVIGCGVDFFCYFSLSAKYKKTFYRLFCFKKTRSETVAVESSDKVKSVCLEISTTSGQQTDQ